MDPGPPEVYTLSLHDALPIYARFCARHGITVDPSRFAKAVRAASSILDDAQEHVYDGEIFVRYTGRRSEEHTSELQSQSNLVCRLLLEKKKQKPQHSRFLHHA